PNDNQRLLGIITERDILRVCAAHPGTLDEIEVTTVMSTSLTVGSPGDSVRDTMKLLTEKRIRHLPVVENDRLVGIISIGDVVKAESNELSAENHYLKEYIQS
ncbi:MAG: CBS domain-containing protein, partial [Planctomycetales bacterium]|nr:CBS domain-containing protein [Planctomycetales bacterium]